MRLIFDCDCCNFCFQLHAEYSKVYDEYLSHRVAQAYELSQFIRFTSHNCDVAILGGDFNIEPMNLGYRLITSNGGLHDAWLERVRVICR